ncbi:hypothetical protein [Rubellicoccus peritrichatus]|uniref:Uncharacterized protein n=1 Tax=Rubellicoccus peritrichatus TaxID=3080537 RepID=A0AAQ3QUB6_9BACT|nr:hypothetical protein [Puniceicoccus sp. CR14]WOO39795.1 hypothetical protein RZN69_14315 [Puniceicoccus sp. CR14]
MKLLKFSLILLFCFTSLANSRLHGSDKDFYCNLYQVGDSLFLFAYGSLNTDSFDDDSTNYDKSVDPSIDFGKNHFKVHLNDDNSVTCERYKNIDVSNLDLPADSITVTFDSNSTYYTGPRFLSFNFKDSSDKVIVYVKESYDTGDTIAFVTKTDDASLSDCELKTDDDGNYESYTYHWKQTDSGDKYEQHFTFSALDVGAEGSGDYEDMIDSVEDYFGDSDDWSDIKKMFEDAY